MADDIVTRLRKAADEIAFGWVSPTIREAADEIKRLEKEILEINLLWNADKAELERLRKVNDKFADDVKTWRKLALAEHWLRVPDHLACDCLDKAARGNV